MISSNDGAPLNFTLVNIRDWCKNDFEVINKLRINHDTSHHRYDVIQLINGIPVTQIELKTLEVSPRRAMEQIVDYKKNPGNGYTNALLCWCSFSSSATAPPRITSRTTTTGTSL